MLPPFIIEQIRKREEEEERRQHQEQPTLELPLERPRPRQPVAPVDDGERGVIILELA